MNLDIVWSLPWYIKGVGIYLVLLFLIKKFAGYMEGRPGEALIMRTVGIPYVLISDLLLYILLRIYWILTLWRYRRKKRLFRETFKIDPWFSYWDLLRYRHNRYFLGYEYKVTVFLSNHSNEIDYVLKQKAVYLDSCFRRQEEDRKKVKEVKPDDEQGKRQALLLLQITNTLVREAKDDFWFKALPLAQWFGFSVRKSYKDYL